MTLRDYFAAKAMPAIYAELLSNYGNRMPENWREGIAGDAYALADAMLTARAREATK